MSSMENNPMYQPYERVKTPKPSLAVTTQIATTAMSTAATPPRTTEAMSAHRFFRNHEARATTTTGTVPIIRTVPCNTPKRGSLTSSWAR